MLLRTKVVYFYVAVCMCVVAVCVCVLSATLLRQSFWQAANATREFSAACA